MKATLVVILAIVAVAMATDMASDPAWRMFKAKFHRKYRTSAEESRRYVAFKKNLVDIHERNKIDPLAHHSFTNFSDIERSEMLKKLPVPQNIVRYIRPASLSDGDIPTTFDWREKGAVNPIKDQAQCGSCWAFCAVAAIESANFIKNGKLESYAEQQVVDCDDQDSGCNGGWPQRGMDYVTSEGGIMYEKDYKYTAETGTCSVDKKKLHGTVSKSYAIDNNEEAMQRAIMEHGVVAVAVDAGKFNSYSSGIMNGQGCEQGAPDHGVAVVGWGETNGVKYWVVRNSWGASWGEKGYVRLQRGINACGVEDYPQACDA